MLAAVQTVIVKVYSLVLLAVLGPILLDVYSVPRVDVVRPRQRTTVMGQSVDLHLDVGVFRRRGRHIVRKGVLAVDFVVGF